MKEAKEIAAGVIGNHDQLEAAKVIVSVVVVDDINEKIAKMICAVVCEVRDEGFVCVACC